MTEVEGKFGKTLDIVRNETVAALAPVYGDREAKAMVGVIFENIKGWNRVDMALKADQLLSPYIIQEVSSVVKRLLNHEPIQYIFGTAWFYGLKFKVSRDTLIPRPETSELVDYIVGENKNRADLRVLDLCTGSGCIAIALSRNLPFSNVTGVDISEDALKVAEENASVINVHVDFLQTDILVDISEKIVGKYDVIVSNPPYIADKEKATMDRNVIEYEPHLALFVPDTQPLLFYDAIFRISHSHLSATGKVYCEINPLYAARVRDLAVNSGLIQAELVRDSYGKERFLFASKG